MFMKEYKDRILHAVQWRYLYPKCMSYRRSAMNESTQIQQRWGSKIVASNKGKNRAKALPGLEPGFWEHPYQNPK